MKFSTGSSSSSLASDSLSRKSTLCIYTDSDFLNGPKEMDAAGSGNGNNEAAELRRELANVHRALMLQSDALARQQQRAGDLELRLANQNAVTNRRLQSRDQQLTTLVHALLILEAKLKKEQKQISVQFQAKNAQILQQREQIKKLRQDTKNTGYCRSCQHLIGSTSEHTNIETDPEFHSLESVESHHQVHFERSLSYQEKQPQPFQKNSRLSKSFQLPKNEHVIHDNTSSSEEVFENGEACCSQNMGTFVKNKQAFVRKDASRRSRKYSDRKHTSAYLDTVQKRLNNRSQASSSSADDGGQSEKDSKRNSKADCASYDVGEEIIKDIEIASNRIDELLNASQNVGNRLLNDSIQLRKKNNVTRESSLSSKIESMHGIRKRPANDRLSLQGEPSDVSYRNKAKNDNDKPWYSNTSDLEAEMECHYGMRKENLNHYRCKSADDILQATCKDANSSKIPNEYLPSPALPTNANNENCNINYESLAKIESNYDSVPRNENLTSNFESGNSKFDNEPSENWYASASDQDEDQSCGIYKNNPVLECVNQILLQNNLDESTVEKSKPHETSPKASTKRVQFSTLNSISFEEHIKRNDESANNRISKEIRPAERRGNNKIVKFSLETASEHSYEVPVSSEGFNYEVQSIYSNDYEPIITKPCNGVANNGTQKSNLKPIPMPRLINSNKQSEGSKKLSVKNMAMSLENKMTGNHYVDMETKFGSEGGNTKIKTKVPRVPPALPPKPKNLLSKFKFNHQSSKNNNPVPAVNLLNSDTVEDSQRIADVPSPKAKQDSLNGSIKSSTEPDYCSISEVSVPVAGTGKNGLITTVEVHAEQFSTNVAERRPTNISKVATIAKIIPNKISDKDIPKLPQVTEIIIPDEDETKDNAQSRLVHENYLSNVGQNAKIDSRNSIQIGHSVSTILSDIKNRNVNVEEVNKCILSPDHKRQYPNIAFHKPVSAKTNDTNKVELQFEAIENDGEKFDLSQNFEEFKIDDCEFTNINMAEEYKISSSDGSSTDSTMDELIQSPCETTNLNGIPEFQNSDLYRMEHVENNNPSSPNHFESINGSLKSALKNSSKMSNKPDLLSNIDSVETDSVRYSDLESTNSSSSNCGSYNTVTCEPATIINETIMNPKTQKPSAMAFEYFLESTGLSSKSILSPSRPPNSNHKNVLKPKDIKMRSKNMTTIGRPMPLYEKCTNTAIKYIEPYL